MTETNEGFAVDGRALPTDVVDANFGYADDRGDGHSETIHAVLLREHHGARVYSILRDRGEHPDKTWTVPAGAVFVLGFSSRNIVPRGERIGQVVN